MNTSKADSYQLSSSSSENSVTSNRYKPAYLRRRLKMLCSSPSILSEGLSKRIAIHCWHNLQDEEAVLLLVSLLVGWSVPQLLLLRNEDIQRDKNYYYLRSSWKFNDLKLPQMWKSFHIKSSEYGVIPLPSVLAQRLIEVINSPSINDNRKALVETYLGNKFDVLTRRPTLTGIRRNIECCAKAVGLSRAELDFISGIDQHNSMQSFYVCFNQADMHVKLIKYQSQLLGVDPDVLEVKPFNENFGSKRALTSAGVKAVFESHLQCLRDYSQLTQQEFHNRYTSYLLELFHLVTLMRPVSKDVVKRNSFANDFSSLLIVDKGESSLRRIPVPFSVRKIFHDYIGYLMALDKRQRFVYPMVANEITRMVDGDAPFFQYWDLHNDKMVKADTAAFNSSLIDQYPLHRNWHRHTIATHLVMRGQCRDSLKAFMGHNPPLDHTFSGLSSLSFGALRGVSENIELLLKHWDIPLLSPLSKMVGGPHV
ncbi:site-specific integrase [Paraglaciecola polaris]|uniref:Uncharacterized protein n=1 Tax=Paraglaciecola polaris LMG 21857 TaxID=1129793 RepID=K6YQD2_9ALTE|nr:hypothetical protein [Paraglaciecola polaris]GAC34949.1 hypothetical protein GPLA_4070 [Paraglaciecola polaris LMG 21857]